MKKIFALVGENIGKSPILAMYNSAIKHLNINAEFKIFDIKSDNIENLANFCYESDLNKISAFIVDNPYKMDIMAYMEEYDPLAKIVGSANTVINDNCRLIAYNTDSNGIIQALQEKIDLKNKKILILGAGAIAKSASYGLKEFGNDIYIFNRTEEKAKILSDEFKLNTIDYRDIANNNFDIIINATSIGNKTDSLLSSSQINGSALVMDLVISPLETKLLNYASEMNIKTVSGDRVLLWKSIDQFRIFFEEEAPVKIMEKAMYEELKKCKI